MTAPGGPARGTADSKLIRIALWVAIGALIAAAIVCVIWVLVGTGSGLVGRAFLTILLLAGFAGAALLDARLAPRRPAWFALASMVTWVVILLFGAILIWMPRADGFFGMGMGAGIGRFMSFLLITLVLLLALLHARLLIKAHARYVTGFTRAVTIITIALVVILAVLLVIPLAFHEFVTFGDPYWRAVVAFAILAAVGTALMPLVNALFAPKERAAAAPAGYVAAPRPWPTYADGVTPLPVMPDGSPDWNAYYTGYPSAVPQAIAPVAPVAAPGTGSPWAAPGPTGSPSGVESGPTAPATGDSGSSVPPGWQGYPPPPPLPPRS